MANLLLARRFLRQVVKALPANLFAGQYSVIDGEHTLRARGISLIWVDTRAGS